MHAYNYIHSILISGSDGAAGGQACPEAIRNPVAFKLLVSGLLA